MDCLCVEHKISMRRACRVVGISCSVYRYEPNTERDDEVILGIQKAAQRYPAYGFSKLFQILRRWGHPWNHKRVHRLYCRLNLNKRRRGKKRKINRDAVRLTLAQTVNECWSIDFMSDSLYCGRRFRTFNVVDDFSREVLAIEVDIGLPSERVVRVLERIVAWRGYPTKMRMDNGPELISATLAEWAEENKVDMEFIQPGKPTQNSYIERFNRTFREEVLNRYVFKTLNEVREIKDNWMTEYNEERPHDSLGNLTPYEYMVTSKQPDNSRLLCA